MSNHEQRALTEVASTMGTSALDAQVSRLSELPALDARDPAMVFMSQIAHRWNLAKMLVKSGMIPQKSPEAAIAVMLKGHELGVSPMVAFANMFFFDGKLGMSADLMAALFIQKAGGRMQVIEWTATVCRVRFWREGWEPSVVEYTEEDAKKAGLLGKPNWKNVKAMLSARCRAMGVRLLAPDVFAGVYSKEEIEDMREVSPGRYVPEADFEEEQPARGAAGLNARLAAVASAEPEREVSGAQALAAKLEREMEEKGEIPARSIVEEREPTEEEMEAERAARAAQDSLNLLEL